MLVIAQAAEGFDDEHQPTLCQFGLFDQQLLAIGLLLIGADEGVAGERALCAVLASIAIVFEVRTLSLALLDETARRRQLFPAELFLGIGIHQCALGTFGVGLRDFDGKVERQ